MANNKNLTKDILNKIFKDPSIQYGLTEFDEMKLFAPFLDKRENPRHKSIRLIGVKVEKLG